MDAPTIRWTKWVVKLYMPLKMKYAIVFNLESIKNNQIICRVLPINIGLSTDCLTCVHNSYIACCGEFAHMRAFFSQDCYS